MENLSITGSADISLFGETRDDLTKNKTFDGGSMTITNRAPFSVDASVYEEDDDAYTNTEGNSERLWEVRPEDEEVYLGTLTYTNDFLEPIDFGETAVGSIIDITLDTPAQGELRGNGNFFLDIDQEREGAETLEVGFRGLDPNNFEFISTDGETTGVIPYRFDFLGGRPSGSDEEIDPSFTFTVEDNSTVSVDLYGRVFALDTGELPVNDDGGDSGSEGDIPIDTDEDEPDIDIEDGTDSEADDTIADGGADDTTVDDSSDETPTLESDVSSDAPVDTDTDAPDTEGGTEDGIESEPDDIATDEPTTQDTITDLQNQIDGLQPLVDQGIISQEVLDDLESQVEELLEIANGGSSDSPDETPTPDSDTDSDVGEVDDIDTPVDTDDSDAEDDGGTDFEPEETTPGEDNPTVDDSPGENPPTSDSEIPVVSSGDQSLLSNDFDSGSEFFIGSISTEQIDPLASDEVTTEVVTVSGSGIPNQLVELTILGVYSDNVTTTSDPDGSWSIEIPEPLVDEEYLLIATQSTPDGSDLLSDQETLKVDTDFDIEFDFSDPSFQDLPSGQQNEIREFIEEAGEFWEDVIIGGLPNEGDIDDIKFPVSVEKLASGTLAEASPIAFRSDGNKLPYRGEITINESTVDKSVFSSPLLSDEDKNKLIVDTIKHEIGHALGFSKDHLLTNRQGDLLTGIEDSIIPGQEFVSGDFGFTGDNALKAYQQQYDKNATFVPMQVASIDNPGSIEDFIEINLIGGIQTKVASIGHWREDILGDEIMTPELNDRPVFLSAVTVGAFKDLGYEVFL